MFFAKEEKKSSGENRPTPDALCISDDVRGVLHRDQTLMAGALGRKAHFLFSFR